VIKMGQKNAAEPNQDSMTIECRKCKKELKIPMDIYEVVGSATTWIDYSCSGAACGFYNMPNENKEPFKSLTTTHDGFCVSKHTGYFYCDRLCLQMSDDKIKQPRVGEISEYWRTTKLK